LTTSDSSQLTLSIKHLDAIRYRPFRLCRDVATELRESLGTHPMARKKKLDDLTPPPTNPQPHPDTGRQPRILGWLVLIAGASSTWYWYRPLPQVVQETTNATLPTNWPTSQTGPKSLWSEQGLVVPSLSAAYEPIPATPSELIATRDDNSGLVGAPKVALMPSNEWNEPRQDIREALKTEKIPLVPIEANTAPKPLLQGPKLWTNDQNAPQSNSLSSVKNNWPDQGYAPPPNPKKEQMRAATKITTQIPPLLETGMRTIKTKDETEANGPAASTETPQTMPTQSPPRQPQFIRQPRT
jgi:hypothetical protein